MQLSRVSGCLAALLTIVAAATAFGDTAPVKGTVTIYRDTWGVPHIYAKTPAEGAYGLGYAQAQDRLEDIYIAIRTGLGRLCEIDGPSKDGIKQDYIMKVCRNEELAKEYWDKKAPKNIKDITANFTAGIQRYIDEHPEQKSKYAIKIEPWYVLTVGRAMILRWPLGTIMDDLKHGQEKQKQRTAQNLPMRSNEWCVAPSRSAAGVPILLSDPHLTWEGLAVMYEARVHAGDLQMNGFFLAGGPILGIGHNQHVGWALTTGGPDTSDVYKMKFKMGFPPLYEYDGKWRKAKMKFITVDIKGAKPLVQPAVYTHLGPLLSQPDKKTGEGYVGASPYLDSMGLYDEFVQMAMARNVHDVYKALGMNQYNEQNVMFADDSGSIAYVRNGATPIRPSGYDWSAPVPGITSATAWKGIHPIDDLVHVFNPPQGYMENCNISPENMMVGSSLTPDKYPKYIYNVSWDNQNPRSKRAIQLLDPDHHVTEEKAKAICMDVHDILADTWKQALRDAIKSSGAEHLKSADFAAAVQAILDWDGQYLPESTATPVYKFWRLKAGKALDLSPLGKKQALSAAANAKLLDLLAETIAELQKRYGKWNVAWGEIHKVGRGGVYFPVGGADYDSGDKEANFSETLFDVKCEDKPDKAGHYIAHNGSMATILMFFYKDGVRSFTCTPWGASADPKSPHYMDQGEKLYSKRQMKPTWWAEADLMPHVESKTVLDIR